MVAPFNANDLYAIPFVLYELHPGPVDNVLYVWRDISFQSTATAIKASSGSQYQNIPSSL